MSSQISKDEKPDSDKFLLDYSRRRHSGSGSNAPAGQTEISREDMVLKNMHGELEKGMKNIVGPDAVYTGFLPEFFKQQDPLL
jgi:hypothetical protein